MAPRSNCPNTSIKPVDRFNAAKEEERKRKQRAGAVGSLGDHIHLFMKAINRGSRSCVGNDSNWTAFLAEPRSSNRESNKSAVREK